MASQWEIYAEVINTLRESQIRHTVTLFIWNDIHDLREGGGSATCVELGGQHYLLTAAHVIDTADVEHIGVVFDRERRANNKFVVEKRWVGGKQGDPLDIGLLKLSPEGVAAISQTKEFVSEERVLCAEPQASTMTGSSPSMAAPRFGTSCRSQQEPSRLGRCATRPGAHRRFRQVLIPQTALPSNI